MAFREAEGPERPEVVWRRRIPDGPYGEHGPPETRAAARPGRRPRRHGRGALEGWGRGAAPVLGARGTRSFGPSREPPARTIRRGRHPRRRNGRAGCEG